VSDRAGLVRQFAAGDAWFHTSPLYRVLSRVVAGDEELLDLAAQARPGQVPANTLMAAVHLLVLKDPELPFARFFPTVLGDDAEPPERAGAEFRAFCAEHRDAIVHVVRERLVQTNAPGRGTAIRLAMHEIADRVDGQGADRDLALAEGHGRWIQPLADRPASTAAMRGQPPASTTS